MSHSLLAVIVLGAFLVLAGMAALLVVIGSARINGPDTDQRDPYRLAGRDSDAPAVDLDLALARDTGVDRTPDGSHENRSDVDASRWAAEIEWLYAAMPEAVALDQGDDLMAPPPIIPGRDTTP